MRDVTKIELRVDGRKLSTDLDAPQASFAEGAAWAVEDQRWAAATWCLYWTARSWAAMLALDFDEIEYALTKATLYAKVLEGCE